MTPEQAHGLQDGAGSGAVFYNFTKGLCTLEAFQRGPNGEGPPGADQFAGNNLVMAVGWNREIQERRGGQPCFVGMSEVWPERQSALDGWHYADFKIDDDRRESRAYEDGTKLPTTWGGLSGGAVWQIWRPDRSREGYVKILRGVPFYEFPRRGGRTMSIRAHFDLSLRRLLHKAGVPSPVGLRAEETSTALGNLPVPVSAVVA